MREMSMLVHTYPRRLGHMVIDAEVPSLAGFVEFRPIVDWPVVMAGIGDENVLHDPAGC